MPIEPNDLLDLADALIGMEPRRLEQISLRRAISCSYYAIFHKLSTGAARYFGLDRELQQVLARTAQHQEMKEYCLKVSTQPSSGNQPNKFRKIVNPTEEIDFIASTFVRLQAKRHEADYDHSAVLTRSDTQTQVALARRACEVWDKVCDSDGAKRLAVLILQGKRLADRL